MSRHHCRHLEDAAQAGILGDWGFTCNFRSQYQRTRKELFPVLSRIQNIGYELGENSRTAEWYRANHRTPWVATSATPAQEWVLA